MDYDAAGDFDINKAVAEMMSLRVIGRGIDEDGSVAVLEHDGVHPANTFAMNYCVDPSDAWPIILEHGIGIEPRFNGDWEAFVVNCWDFDEESYTKSQWWTDSSPLRAAMIVFIKIMEAKNAVNDPAN